MSPSLLGTLITSKMRVRILMRLFLNPAQQVYLRELASEFRASPSQVREELNSLRETGLLETDRRGRQTYYAANPEHPLYPELHSMVKKSLGMDRILESVISRLGDLRLALLLDDYAQGKDTGIIDLLLVGNINRPNLDDLVMKTEGYIGRKIRTLVLSEEEYGHYDARIRDKPHLVLWSAD